MVEVPSDLLLEALAYMEGLLLRTALWIHGSAKSCPRRPWRSPKATEVSSDLLLEALSYMEALLLLTALCIHGSA